VRSAIPSASAICSAPPRFGAQHGFQLADGFAQIDGVPVDRLLAEQHAQPADDLAGAQVVVANVGQNRARLVMPIRTGSEQLQAALRR
jgi:hypothetical protein